MASPDQNNDLNFAELARRLPLRTKDLAIPLLLLAAFLLIAIIITVTDTAAAYGGYLAVLFVGITYPLPWNRISYLAAFVASIALVYWSQDTWMSRQDALTGLAISMFMVWAVAVAVGRIQYLEGHVETRDQQLDLALEASDLGIFHWDLRSNRLFAHGKLRELWGITSDRPLHSDDMLDRVHPEDVDRVREAIATALAGKGVYDVEFRLVDKRTGRTRWLLGRGRVMHSVRSRRIYLTGTNLDISGLKEEEERIRSILNGLGMLAGLLKPDGTLIEANSVSLDAAGLEEEDVVGKKFWETWWWSHDRIEQSRLQQAIVRASEGETVQYDARIRTGHDDYADIAFYLSPVHNALGEVVYLVPSGTDVTERKHAEEQITLLVRELNHRIKNLFSVTNALINLSARHATDIESFVQATLRRLQALHASHAMTGADVTNPQSYYSEVGAAKLAQKVLAPFRVEGDRIEIRGNNMRLDAGEATAFSLILNELTANSIKYGSLSAETGSITLEWLPNEEDDGYLFTWSETGGPPVKSLEGKGFGHSIISLLTKNYLDGECEFSATENGFRFVITVEAEEEDDEEDAEDSQPRNASA